MKIKLDPVTRVEGHMKVEVEIDSQGKVTSAKSTGNMFRGFETLLKGRRALDAVHLTQRICGLCPVSHAIASAKAVEAAHGFEINEQARLMRNLIQGGNYLSDHILHFYHLTLLDYVKGPDRSPWKTAYETDLRFTPQASEALFNNYLKALEVRRKAHEMVALFAGKIPHVMSIMPGGVTKSPIASEIQSFKQLLGEVTDFINHQYYEDVQKVASVYRDYYKIGKGYGNLISFGVFEVNQNNQLFRQGRYNGGKYMSLDARRITEDAKFAWYNDGVAAVKDSAVVPMPDKAGAYSWVKAPRYLDIPHEAGPLARLWLNGDYRKGMSVMDRHAARMLESRKIAHAMSRWIDEIVPNASAYSTDIHSNYRTGRGIGLTEAPRGALMHYVDYENRVIKNYQIVTPTCWNASPMDSKGMPGPIEQALTGITVEDANNPVELIRVIHSFDPCTACAVHVIEPEKEISRSFILGA